MSNVIPFPTNERRWQVGMDRLWKDVMSANTADFGFGKQYGELDMENWELSFTEDGNIRFSTTSTFTPRVEQDPLTELLIECHELEFMGKYAEHAEIIKDVENLRKKVKSLKENG